MDRLFTTSQRGMFEVSLSLSLFRILLQQSNSTTGYFIIIQLVKFRVIFRNSRQIVVGKRREKKGHLIFNKRNNNKKKRARTGQTPKSY